MADNQDGLILEVLNTVFGRTRRGRTLLVILAIVILIGCLVVEYWKSGQPSAPQQQQSVTVITGGNAVAEPNVPENKKHEAAGADNRPSYRAKGTPRTLVVSGRVSDESSGVPLDSVGILADGRMVATSGNGYYKLSVPWAGMAAVLDLGYKRSGYKEVLRSVVWEGDQDTCYITFDVTLKQSKNEDRD